MINVIVPLAGPDLIDDYGTIKCERDFHGSPFLHSVLKSRKWWSRMDDLNFHFVFQDLPETRDFFETRLRRFLPNAKAVFLSDLAKGAALSVLAACSIIEDPMLPLIVDFGDILFTTEFNVFSEFLDCETTEAVAFTFKSQELTYSYFAVDELGSLSEAREKVVISDNASTGVYLFRNVPTYIGAVAKLVKSGSAFQHNGLWFVTPAFNFLSKTLDTVKLVSVDDVVDPKLSY